MKTANALCAFAALIASSHMLIAAEEHSLPPQMDRQVVEKLVADNSAFAFDLYQKLLPQEGNLLFSPYSVSQALAMTYAGAEGATKEQMAGALHFGLADDKLHPAFHALDAELMSRGKNAKGMAGQPFALHIANAIWGQQSFDFLESFTRTLNANYGAGLHQLDFQTDPDAARKMINDWVAEKTEDKIKELFDQGSLGADTRLVLTNAIYFNAAWKDQFKDANTQDDTFHLRIGDTVQLPMMNQTERFAYVEQDGMQAVELPYDGRQVSMVVLLPKEGDFRAFEEGLCADRVAALIESLSPRRVKLTMPRFEYKSRFKLCPQMAQLGMIDAFTERADFSGMTGQRDLSISLIVHEAYIKVNEEGTEAAAATGVAMRVTSIEQPVEPVVMKIDRPFIYLIRDRATGAILFIGRVLDPRA